MAQIYRIKEGKEWADLQPLGYEVSNVFSSVLFTKEVPQDFDGELCQARLNNIYRNPEWRTKIYDPHRKTIRNTIGLKYRKGKVVLSEQLKSVITGWMVLIDMSDGWVGFKSGDPFDQRVYYATVHLDTYCADEIKALQDADLIEVIEVQEEAEDA